MNMRSLIQDVIPPIMLRPALKVWCQARGLASYNFEGAWPSLADVPVRMPTADDDPWADATSPDWRKKLADRTAHPVSYDIVSLILPLLVSQMTGPFTVLDYGGGAAVQLGIIPRYAPGVDLSQMTYVLVETPAMARMVRSEVEARGGRLSIRSRPSLRIR